MTYIRDDQLQAAWIDLLQGNTNITAEVAAAQIKELQPQTTSFTYPGIRIRVGPNTPSDDSCPQEATVRILVFSEDASSQQVMRIAGIITQQYHDKSFTTTGLGQSMQITGITARPLPAVRQDMYTWREEVVLEMLVG